MTGHDDVPLPTSLLATPVEYTAEDGSTRTIRHVHPPGVVVPTGPPECPPSCGRCHPRAVTCAVHGGAVEADQAIRVATSERGSGAPLVQYACLACARIHNLRPEPDEPGTTAAFVGYRDSAPGVTQ